MPQYCDDWPATDTGIHRYWRIQNCLWRRDLVSAFRDEWLTRSKPCNPGVCIQQRRSVSYKLFSSCIRLQIGADICTVPPADAIVTGDGVVVVMFRGGCVFKGISTVAMVIIII